MEPFQTVVQNEVWVGNTVDGSEVLHSPVEDW